MTVLIVMLAGCGGSGEDAAVGPTPPADGGDILEIGPLVVQTEKTAGFKAQHIFANWDCAFVALYGAQINYLASTAMMDRVVFASSRSGHYNIYVCNLDGRGTSLVQLTNNGAIETYPRWSPDGSKIAFSRQWPGQKPVICTMNADGTGAAGLTSNASSSVYPDWSPDGGRLTYTSDSGGNADIWTMYADGSNQTNITNDAPMNLWSTWSPDGSLLAFSTLRYVGAFEIATIDVYAGTVVRLTNDAFTDIKPAWDHSGSYRVAYTSTRHGNAEVFTMSWSGSHQKNSSCHGAADQTPRWSSDGSLIAFQSNRSGNTDIWIGEVNEPYRQWQVTKHSGSDAEPDLGSPTVQTERVLIGPAGSDRGGTDPLHPSAAAVIAAFDEDGYRNLVRIGVASTYLAGMQIKPFENAGHLSGVEVSATQIANLRQDAGWGNPPKVWDFNALNAGMVLLYFNSETGKLASAVAVKDSAYSTAIGAEKATYVASAAGDGMKLTGEFAGVFDAEGRNLAPSGTSSVTLGQDGEVFQVN